MPTLGFSFAFSGDLAASPWSPSNTPHPAASESHLLDLDTLLSGATDTSSSRWDLLDDDQLLSAGPVDDAFEASDEMDLDNNGDDDDEAGSSECWFPSSASSRAGGPNQSFVIDGVALPITGSRIAFSASFEDGMA